MTKYTVLGKRMSLILNIDLEIYPSGTNNDDPTDERENEIQELVDERISEALANIETDLWEIK